MRRGWEAKLRRNHWLASGFKSIVTAVLTAFLLSWSGQAFAQGFGLGQLLGGSGGGNGGSGGGGSGGGGGLSQLFGGSGGGSRHQHSSEGSGISVERSAAPYTGKFTGSQSSQGMQSSITAEFACYPASDADIPQARAFVCYAGGSNSGDSPSSGGPPNGASYGHSGGRSGDSPSDSGAPNGPPPGVE